MAKNFNIKKTHLYKNIEDLTSTDMWPFKTVTADEFIKASSQLLELYHYSLERTIDGQDVSAEAYMDRTTEATIMMLRCIQKMKLEASSREMESMLNWSKSGVYDMEFVEAQRFVEDATMEMYEYNNHICDLLLPDLNAKNLRTRYIDMESERDYMLGEDCVFAIGATENHYAVMKDAYDEIDNLIKYGLPSTSVVGQIKDVLIETRDVKRNNQTIVDKILNSEADLEVVKLYILPGIDLRIQEYSARAQVEEAMTKDKKSLAPGELRQTDPYFFRNQLKLHVAAREMITNALIKMNLKETKLESSYKLSIDRDPKTATFMLTASWAIGDKSVEKKTEHIASKLDRKSTIIKENKRREKRIKLQLGQSSHQLYEETKLRSACRLGYTNRQELAGQRHSLVNVLSAHLLKSEAYVQRKTNVMGKSGIKAKQSIDIAKVQETVSHVLHREDKKDKETKILDISIGIGNESAEVDAIKKIPVVKASVKNAEASIKIAGISASASADTISFNTDPGVVNQVKKALFDNIVSEEKSTLPEHVQKIVNSSVKKLYTVSRNEPMLKAGVTVSGINLFSVSTNGEETKIKNRFPDVQKTIKDGFDSARELIDKSFEQLEFEEGSETVILPTDPNFKEISNSAVDMEIINVSVNEDLLKQIMEQLRQEEEQSIDTEIPEVIGFEML